MPADLLLLHGFTQTGASWAGVIRALAGRYRPLAPELGTGPWGEELDRLEALAPDGAVVAGYSMGGRLGAPPPPPRPAGARARAPAPRAGAAARARGGEPRSGARRGTGGAARRRRRARGPHRADR